jgi:hypothetical protein
MRKRAAACVLGGCVSALAQVGPQHGMARALCLMGAHGPLAVDYLEERGRCPACRSNTHTRKL